MGKVWWPPAPQHYWHQWKLILQMFSVSLCQNHLSFDHHSSSCICAELSDVLTNKLHTLSLRWQSLLRCPFVRQPKQIPCAFKQSIFSLWGFLLTLQASEACSPPQNTQSLCIAAILPSGWVFWDGYCYHRLHALLQLQNYFLWDHGQIWCWLICAV